MVSRRQPTGINSIKSQIAYADRVIADAEKFFAQDKAKLTARTKRAAKRGRDPAEVLAQIEQIRAADDRKRKLEIDERTAGMTAWERARWEKEQLGNTCEHEAMHAVVGLHVGAKVEAVEINDDFSGICRFESIPRGDRQLVFQAGSHNAARSLWSDEASGDRQYWDVIQDERFPGRTKYEREYIDADVWASNRDHIDRILFERGSFKFALQNYLIEHRKIDGRELHKWWDEYFAGRT